MNTLLRLAQFQDQFATSIGKAASWLILPLIIIINIDVITRKIDVFRKYSAQITIEYGYSPSFIMQDLEWHIHGVLLLLTFGFAYMKDAHVRVDVFREMLSERSKVWLEFLGLCGMAIPFLAIMIFYSWLMTSSSFSHWEGSESQVGLGWRFVIKSFLVTGFFFAFLASLATAMRCVVYLFGSTEAASSVRSNLQFLPSGDALPTEGKASPSQHSTQKDVR